MYKSSRSIAEAVARPVLAEEVLDALSIFALVLSGFVLVASIWY